MIPRRFSSVCCAAFASLIAPILLVAQDPSSDGLGGAHGRLAAYQGEWVVTLTQPESGASVARGSGTAVARLRLDGRFLEIETSVDGGPVRQTVHMLGYDIKSHWTRCNPAVEGAESVRTFVPSADSIRIVTRLFWPSAKSFRR